MSVYRTIGPLVIDLVAKHKSGELRCPATGLIVQYSFKKLYVFIFHLSKLHENLKHLLYLISLEAKTFRPEASGRKANS